MHDVAAERIDKGHQKIVTASDPHIQLSRPGHLSPSLSQNRTGTSRLIRLPSSSLREKSLAPNAQMLFARMLRAFQVSPRPEFYGRASKSEAGGYLAIDVGGRGRTALAMSQTGRVDRGAWVALVQLVSEALQTPSAQTRASANCSGLPFVLLAGYLWAGR